jgi:MFS family permease
MGWAQWRAVLAAWAGWLLDGYVTIAYALSATLIAPLFFPGGSRPAALIMTFLAFSANGVARPLGSVVFGNYVGDRMGRRAMLVLTVLGFSLLGTSRAFLPTYGEIGILAPALLFLILFIEGMFAGAEYGGGTALSMEQVPPERRGAVGAFVQSGFGTGYFIAALAYGLLSRALGPGPMASVGWRYLFATSVVPGLVAFALRYATPESPVFSDMARSGAVERIPAWRLVRESWRELGAALMITTGLLAINGITFSLYPTIFLEYSGLSGYEMGVTVALVNLISLLGVWSGGALASSLLRGRRRAMLIYSAAFLASMYPASLAVLRGGMALALAGSGAQAFLEAMIFAPLPAFLSESFSRRYRATGAGLAYNGGLIVGSFAIPITLAAAGALGFPIAWPLTIAAWGALMIAGMLLSRETWSAGAGDAIAR